MSADISAARGVSAAETSEALWAADGLDLSTDGELDLSIDGSYVAADALSPPDVAERGPGIGHARARTCLITASAAMPQGRSGFAAGPPGETIVP
jgi:hypothetical protein